MGLLQDRKILVTGLLSNRSIAYGIARALAREGATLAFTYQNEDLRGRVVDLAKEFGPVPVLPCDVASDQDITALFAALAGRWDGLDGIVHSIAFAPREALKGELLDNLTREAFHIAHDSYGRAFGLRALLGRATAHVRNRSIANLYMHCLSENAAMMHIARKSGMTIVAAAGDADAHLALSPADPASITGEYMTDRFALYDYALKAHVAAWKRVNAALEGAAPAR